MKGPIEIAWFGFLVLVAVVIVTTIFGGPVLALLSTLLLIGIIVALWEHREMRKGELDAQD